MTREEITQARLRLQMAASVEFPKETALKMFDQIEAYFEIQEALGPVIRRYDRYQKENDSPQGREKQRVFILADLSLLADKYKKLLTLYHWICDCGAEWQDTEQGFSSCPSCSSYGKLAEKIGRKR